MAALNFDPNTGVSVPTTKEIREDLVRKYIEAFRVNADDPDLNVDSASPMGQVIDAHVAETEASNSEKVFLANMYNMATARGLFLDGLASLYFLERKISEPTVVTCQCSGLKGTAIPYGAIVQDTQGNQLRHSVAGGAVIGDAGTVDTIFTTVDHGAIEVKAKTVTKIVTVVAGWDSITNNVAGVLGRDRESDTELRTRIQESVAINANGSADSILSTLRNTENVIDAVVIENITNERVEKFGLTLEPHSVGISVYGGDDADIAKVIWSKKSAGCGTSGDYAVTHTDEEHLNAKYVYKITRPKPTTLHVKISLWLNSLDDGTQTTIKRAIVQDFFGQLNNDRVGMAETLFGSRFVDAINMVAKVPVHNVQVALGDTNYKDRLTINATQEPTLTETDVTIAFSGE